MRRSKNSPNTHTHTNMYNDNVQIVCCKHKNVTEAENTSVFKSITLPSKCLEKGHDQTSNYYRHTQSQRDILSLSCSLCIWLLHSGINRKEAANETNCVVCVFYEKNSLCCLGSLPQLSDWLAPKWSAFLLWALIGARECQWLKNFFSLFSSGPTLVVFKLRAGRAGLRQSSTVTACTLVPYLLPRWILCAGF